MVAFKKFIEVLMHITDERSDFLSMFDKNTMKIEIALYNAEGDLIDSIWLDKEDFPE